MEICEGRQNLQGGKISIQRWERWRCILGWIPLEWKSD
jgi:hypothetical protein